MGKGGGVMDAWTKRRNSNGWHNGLVEWIEDDTAYLSVVFSWHLQEAYQRAAWHRAFGRVVVAGGPAVNHQPNYLSDVATIGTSYTDAIQWHNPFATFTSRGCVRNCKFCLVPKIEGPLVELDDWPIRPIICDNNLLACSQRHFDDVIDKLKPLSGIDFNQGLDARLLTKHHAERIAELDLKMVRLAWDHIGLERQFAQTWQILRDVGIPKRKIGVYVLIGYRDTPEDALYRLRSIWERGSWPYPMRYQPLDAIKRNQYVGEHWTDAELKRYMRYWTNVFYLSGIPFEEFGMVRGAA